MVEQLYGLETIRNAAEQLKAQYGSKGKMRLKLFISVKGIKLFDAYTFVSDHECTRNPMVPRFNCISLAWHLAFSSSLLMHLYVCLLSNTMPP